MNLKNLKYLKKGMKELSPHQLIHGKIAGYIGMIIGLCLATYTMFMRKSWGLGIFLVFLSWFQLMGLLGELKQYQNMKEMEQQVHDHAKEFDKALEEAEKEMEVTKHG